MKTKYRIVRTWDGWYVVQRKFWWFPFWMDMINTASFNLMKCQKAKKWLEAGQACEVIEEPAPEPPNE